MKNYIIALLLIIQPLLLFPQYSIKGKITNKEWNKPLAGAHIILDNSYLTSVSDANGAYLIDNLKPGFYKIRASFIGYKTQTISIEIQNDLTIDFELEMNLVMSDEVIIVATRVADKTPTTYSHLDKKEISKNNLGQDIPYLLETIPSTVITSDAGTGVGYSGLRIRGSDMTRINVTLNGIPLNDPESHGVFWVNLPDFASSIDHIQVQRGVGTSTNGAAAFGASINIQTLNLNQNAFGEVNSTIGSFNTFKNNLIFGSGLIDGKFTFDGRVSKITSDGFIDRAFSNLKSFFVSGGYYGKNTILKLNIFSGKEKTYQAWSGVPKEMLATNRTFNPYTYENETDNYQQDHYQLLFSQQLDLNFLFNIALHYTHGEGFYEQYKENRDLSDYQIEGNLETDLIQQKWLDNDFYGVTYSLKYEDKQMNAIIGGAWNKYKGDHFGEVIWVQKASEIDFKHRWYENTGDKTDFNIFSKVNYALDDNFNLYADFQYRRIAYDIDGIHDDLRDISQSHDFNFINPKAGIYITLNNNSSAYLSYAIANREPSRSDYRDSDANHSPKSEQLRDLELGYSFISQNAKIEANIYYMDYKNQLVLTGEINNVGAAILTNADDSYRAGLEISAGIKLCSKVSWNFNFTFSENKIKNFVSFVDNWSPPYTQLTENLGSSNISFSPTTIISSSFNFQASNNFNISFVSKYVSRQYIDNTSNIERSLDPYFINNLTMEYSFKTNLFKALIARLRINNIFDHKYESNAWVYRYFYAGEEYVMDGYFPQAGINFLMGLSIKF